MNSCIISITGELKNELSRESYFNIEINNQTFLKTKESLPADFEKSLSKQIRKELSKKNSELTFENSDRSLVISLDITSIAIQNYKTLLVTRVENYNSDEDVYGTIVKLLFDYKLSLKQPGGEIAKEETASGIVSETYGYSPGDLAKYIEYLSPEELEVIFKEASEKPPIYFWNMMLEAADADEQRYRHTVYIASSLINSMADKIAKKTAAFTLFCTSDYKYYRLSFLGIDRAFNSFLKKKLKNIKNARQVEQFLLDKAAELEYDKKARCFYNLSLFYLYYDQYDKSRKYLKLALEHVAKASTLRQIDKLEKKLE